MDKINTEQVNLAKKLSRSQRLSVAQDVAERWEVSTQAIQHLIDDSLDAWNYYLDNRPTVEARTNSKDIKTPSKDPQSKGVRLGYIPKTVDSVLAIQQTALFPSDGRFFRGTPNNDDSKENQEFYEALLEKRLSQTNADEEFRAFRLNQMLDGTAALHVYHEVQKKEKVFYEKPTFDIMNLIFEGEGKPVKKVREEITYDGPVVKALSFNDWRVDPHAKSFDEFLFC
jgi:hypothetical protein